MKLTGLDLAEMQMVEERFTDLSDEGIIIREADVMLSSETGVTVTYYEDSNSYAFEVKS